MHYGPNNAVRRRNQEARLLSTGSAARPVPPSKTPQLRPRSSADADCATITRGRLLLVDADRLAQLATTEAMTALLGMAVRSVDSVKAALDAIAVERFDVVILDVDLPDGDGRDLCVDLRGRGLTMPILMLTGAGQEADVVGGLDAGASDYVVKPLRPYELAARVRAHLRQHEVSEHAEMAVGDQLFRPAERSLSQPGQKRPVRLTMKEAAVLKHLYRADGAMVTREELLHHVWGYSADAATHTVETHVYRLRRKVEPNRDSPRVLLHERGGYRLLRADPPERVPAHAGGVNGYPVHPVSTHHPPQPMSSVSSLAL